MKPLWEYFKFLIRGLPTPPDRDFHFLKSGMLIFDIGANMGNYAALFAKRGAKVIALEPQPFCYGFMRYRFLFNGAIKLIQAASGEREGTMQMTVSSAHTLSSLNTEWIKKVNDSQRFKQHGPTWDEKIDVHVTTLDKLIGVHGTPDYIKIDVEGFEKNVIAGLSQKVRCVSFEFTFPELKTDAIDCIHMLDKLGRYDYVSLLDNSGATLVSSETIIGEIETLCNKGELSNGDIFAHLAND
jgi:FkbM family methyltransferase